MAAFEWLRQQALMSDVLSRRKLEAGFVFQGGRVRLVGPQGIFKPAQIRYYPLSITTTTKGPYEDVFDASGDLLLYRYRGIDPDFHENRRLRDAMRDQIPLIYFHSTVPSTYLAIFPVFIVGDDAKSLTFTVAADDALTLAYERDDDEPEIRRGYVTRQARHRIHQRTFRDRVLRAYSERCSICNLRHSSLLDAAHITADSDDLGEPIVSNGLSLCKLHHAAFDRSMFGVKPNYTISVRRDILEESDGPMLLHGLQKIHGREIMVPTRIRDRPNKDRLNARYKVFQSLENEQAC
jgi:putative restriction endonuclease